MDRALDDGTLGKVIHMNTETVYSGSREADVVMASTGQAGNGTNFSDN